MKSFLIRTSLALGLVFTTKMSSAQKFESARDLSDFYASVMDSLYAAGAEWGTQVGKSMETMNFNAVIPIRKKMESFIDKKLSELAKIKDQFGCEDLRLTTMDILGLEKMLTQEAFIPAEKLTKTSTEADIEKLINGLKAAEKKEEAAMVRIKEAQKDCAAKNGFTIDGEN